MEDGVVRLLPIVLHDPCLNPTVSNQKASQLQKDEKLAAKFSSISKRNQHQEAISYKKFRVGLSLWTEIKHFDWMLQLVTWPVLNNRALLFSSRVVTFVRYFIQVNEQWIIVMKIHSEHEYYVLLLTAQQLQETVIFRKPYSTLLIPFLFLCFCLSSQLIFLSFNGPARLSVYHYLHRERCIKGKQCQPISVLNYKIYLSSNQIKSHQGISIKTKY